MTDLHKPNRHVIARRMTKGFYLSELNQEDFRVFFCLIISAIIIYYNIFGDNGKMKKGILISDDALAVNFREICMGKIAPGALYRSSHPIKDNRQERKISALVNNARIAAVINLCDSSSGILSKALYAPWYNALLKSNKVIALGMDFSFTSDSFKRKLKQVLRFIIETNGPWLIHCHAGVDRTGFVSMVLESLMGAKLDDVIEDYLQSFNSVFESSIFETRKTDSLVAMQVLSVMNDSMIIDDQNLQGIAEGYLQKTIGLSAEEMELLKRKLMGIIQ